MTTQQKIAFKNRLKEACYAIIEQRITTTKAAIDEAQQAANLEGKVPRVISMKLPGR